MSAAPATCHGRSVPHERQGAEILLTARGSPCWSYSTTWERSRGFGPTRSGTKESRVERMNWSTEKPQGVSGTGASTWTSVPAYGFMATKSSGVDHAIDALARPMGTPGGRTG